MTIELDHALLLALNQFARRSETFDYAVATVLDRPSVKLLPLVAGLIWLWFRRDGQPLGRVAVAQALAGSFIAALVVRVVQNLLPPRPWPLHDVTVQFVWPYGLADNLAAELSSFPSDTATLAFALATGVLIGARALGVLALVWAALVVSLPRVYLGYHFPSDILAGAALGTACVLMWSVAGLHERLATALGRIETRWPTLFYIAGFVVLFQVTTSFVDVRRIGGVAARIVTAML